MEIREKKAGPAMTPMRALIEAAEAYAKGINRDLPFSERLEQAKEQWRTLQAAISSAKAAEEGVETGMCKDEALAKAQTLWGDQAAVHDATAHGSDCFQVGLAYKNGVWVIGWGRTWEEAFENAQTKPNPLPPISVREKESL